MVGFRVRRWLLGGLSIVLIVVGLPPPPVSARSRVVPIMTKHNSPQATAAAAEISWLMTTVLPGGAIEIWPDTPPRRIVPYNANYGAMGLARQATATGNKAYSNVVWNWLRWYQAHQDSNGYVTDYTISNGVQTSTGTEDSTDAYAGTFLTAAKMAYLADSSQLGTIRTGVIKAIRAILSTQDSDGMTWALPTYHVKYLWDQAETYDGLLAAAYLQSQMGNSYWANVASSAAAKMRAGVQSLWNSHTNSYDWAKQSTGATQTTDWPILYPDALEQVSAVAAGLADSHGPALMATFGQYHANWAQVSAVQNYWPIVAVAYNTVYNVTTGQQGALTIEQAAVNARGAWPFNVETAGLLVLACTDSALF